MVGEAGHAGVGCASGRAEGPGSRGAPPGRRGDRAGVNSPHPEVVVIPSIRRRMMAPTATPMAQPATRPAATSVTKWRRVRMRDQATPAAGTSTAVPARCWSSAAVAYAAAEAACVDGIDDELTPGPVPSSGGRRTADKGLEGGGDGLGDEPRGRPSGTDPTSRTGTCHEDDRERMPAETPLRCPSQHSGRPPDGREAPDRLSEQ